MPAAATAAVVNLTVDAPAGDGYLSAYPCGTAAPLASNLNYAAGRPRGAAATVTLDAAGRLCLRSYAATDVIVDVSGAYVAGDGGARFTPTTPARLVDTRAGGRLAAGDVVTVAVPTGASAATVNLTATGAAGAGFLTAYRCDQPRPLTSNVNYGTGQTVANLAVVPVGADGRLCVYASAATDVIVDLLGTAGAAGLRYQAAAPVRLLDTPRWHRWLERPARRLPGARPARRGGGGGTGAHGRHRGSRRRRVHDGVPVRCRAPAGVEPQRDGVVDGDRQRRRGRGAGLRRRPTPRPRGDRPLRLVGPVAIV